MVAMPALNQARRLAEQALAAKIHQPQRKPRKRHLGITVDKKNADGV